MAFGQKYTSVTVAGPTTAVGTSPVQIASLAVSITVSADYRISWSYLWNLDSTGESTIGRIQLNNTTDIWQNREEPKDNASTQFNSASGFAEVNLTVGSHFFDFDAWNSAAPRTTTLKTIFLEFWQVN